MSLLDELRADLINDSANVATTLRKALVLADEVDSPELRAWTLSELEGYPEPPFDDVPSYRRVYLPVYGTFLGGAAKGRNSSPQAFVRRAERHSGLPACGVWSIGSGIQPHHGRKNVTAATSCGNDRTAEATLPYVWDGVGQNIPAGAHFCVRRGVGHCQD